MEDRSAQAMELEGTVAEDEDMMNFGDELVSAEANGNEVPMLAPLRHEPDKKDFAVKTTNA